jgi:hypothetical protein
MACWCSWCCLRSCQGVPMKQIWTDRRLFITVLAIAACWKVESAPFVAAILAAYMGNRAYVEGKK